MGDAYRLISSRARYWSDASCVELTVEEMEGEGRFKLYKVIEKRRIFASIPDRKQMFKFIATVINNHFRGLVGKNRFTAKRTGQKVPKQGSPEAALRDSSLQKPEISLDANPDIRGMLEFRAVPNQQAHSAEVDDDMLETLTAFEYTVYMEMVNPSEATMALAVLDGARGKVNRDIVITPAHISKSLGIPTQAYHDAVETIRIKFLDYRSGTKGVTPSVKQAPPELRETLTPVEFLVYQQLVAPNPATLAICKARHVTPGVEHLAEGVGMPSELFVQVMVSVRQKISSMSTKESQAPNSTSIRALEKVFSVHVPRTLESVIVRRLFTIAARAQYDKVNEQVGILLRSVGAEVPMLNTSGNLACFGILYARNHRVCSACAARIACAVKAANYGLENVTLSPKLFAPRASVRTAEAGELPAEELHSEKRVPTPPMSEREDELRSYLQQNFRAIEVFREQYYTHKARPADTKARNIVWVGSRPFPTGGDFNPAFMVRFCNPSARVASQLIKVANSFYVKESMPVGEVIKLIDLHANELFAVGSQAKAVPAPKSDAKPLAKAAKDKTYTMAKLIASAMADAMKMMGF